MTKRTIGLNRGISRLWLEGSVLSSNGFNNGDRYSVKNVDGFITIVWHSDGDRKIAGTPQRPIIDINGAKILEGFVKGDVVKLTVSKGLIVITKGE
jgi:hypothetical protein